MRGQTRSILFVITLCLFAWNVRSEGRELVIIVRPKVGEVEFFAADELQRYLHRITGEHIAVRAEPLADAVPLFIGDHAVPAELGAEGYILRSAEGGLVLAGNSPRATLYAVYDFLERLGCRWYYADFEDEIMPRVSLSQVVRIVKAGLHVEERPDFSIRMHRFLVYDIGPEGTAMSKAFMRSLPAVVDWTTKNRMNIFQYGLDHNWDCYRHWKYYRKVFPEMRRRGLIIGAGGHCLFMFLPPDEFEKHPDWFPMVGGQRQPKGQFCTRNEEAVSYYINNVVKFLKDNPEIEYFAPWPNDTRSGWCQCPLCRDTPSADRFMELGHRIYRELRKATPEVRVTHFAYSSHVTPPEKARPLPGMTVTLCTWGRDLSIPLADERTSDKFRSMFADWRGITRDANVDMIFHGKYARHLGLGFHPLPLKVLQADCRWFRQQGLSGFELPCAYMGQRTKSLNFYVLAKLMWDADADVDTILSDYFEQCYADNSASMRKAYEQVELAQPDLRYWARNHSLVPTRMKPGQPYSAQLREYAAKAAEHFEQAQQHVQSALRTSEDRAVRDRITRFSRSLEYTLLEWRALNHMIQASQHVAKADAAANKAAFEQELDAAEHLLDVAQGLSRRRQELVDAEPGSSLYWDVTGATGPYGVFKASQIDGWMQLVTEKRKNSPSS